MKELKHMSWYESKCEYGKYSKWMNKKGWHKKVWWHQENKRKKKETGSETRKKEKKQRV